MDLSKDAIFGDRLCRGHAFVVSDDVLYWSADGGRIGIWRGPADLVKSENASAGYCSLDQPAFRWGGKTTAVKVVSHRCVMVFKEHGSILATYIGAPIYWKLEEVG